MIRSSSEKEKEAKWANQFVNKVTCPICEGQRLNRESLHFRFHDKNIAELASLDIKDLAHWLTHVEQYLNERQKKIATFIKAPVYEGAKVS